MSLSKELELYYNTRKFEHWLKYQMLYLNQNKYPWFDEDRLYYVDKSLKNIKTQNKILNKFKKNNFYNIIQYWEKIGFFDSESRNHLSFKELQHLLNRTIYQFNALSNLCYRLTVFNDKFENPLFLDEDSMEEHKKEFPEHYIFNESNSLDLIINSSLFQQTSLNRLVSQNVNIIERKRLISELMENELEFLFSILTDKIPESKITLFAEIFYSLSLTNQHKNILKLDDVKKSHKNKDLEIFNNVYNSFEDIFDLMKNNKETIIDIVVDTLKNKN